MCVFLHTVLNAQAKKQHARRRKLYKENLPSCKKHKTLSVSSFGNEQAVHPLREILVTDFNSVDLRIFAYSSSGKHP